MRTVFVVLTLGIFIILSIPLFLVTLALGLFSRKVKVRASQAIITFGFRVVFLVSGTKVKVFGAEDVPLDQAVLYVGNHRSYADIPMVYITVPTLVGFVAKKEIQKVPGLNWWMGNINCLFLDRHDMKEGLKTILKGIDHIRSGYSMFVMPEGTRNKGDELMPFKEGSFKMAEKTGCPIIPVAITNSDAIYEKQSPWVKRAKTIIHYGSPIFVGNLSKEEKKFLGARVRDVITEMLKEDRDLVEQP